MNKTLSININWDKTQISFLKSIANYDFDCIYYLEFDAFFIQNHKRILWLVEDLDTFFLY